MLGRKPAEAAHGFAFRVRFALGCFKPAQGFDLPREAPPKRPLVIQSAVSQCPKSIMLGIFGFLLQPEKGDKRFVDNIFRFGMGKSQRPSVEKKLRGFIFIKPFAPASILLPLFSHAALKTPM